MWHVLERGETLARVSVGIPEVKKTLGRRRRRWIYFKMDFSRSVYMSEGWLEVSTRKVL